MTDLMAEIRASQDREIAYLRATLELVYAEKYEMASKLGALRALAKAWRGELVARGDHGLVAIVDEVLAR